MAKITRKKFLELKRRLRKKMMTFHGVQGVIRKCRKKIYLTGRAHRPYKVVAGLETSLEEHLVSRGQPLGSRLDEHRKSDALSSTTVNKEMCNQCLPVLSRYKDLFFGLVHQGTVGSLWL